MAMCSLAYSLGIRNIFDMSTASNCWYRISLTVAGLSRAVLLLFLFGFKDRNAHESKESRHVFELTKVVAEIGVRGATI